MNIESAREQIDVVGLPPIVARAAAAVLDNIPYLLAPQVEFAQDTVVFVLQNSSKQMFVTPTGISVHFKYSGNDDESIEDTANDAINAFSVRATADNFIRAEPAESQHGKTVIEMVKAAVTAACDDVRLLAEIEGADADAAQDFHLCSEPYHNTDTDEPIDPEFEALIHVNENIDLVVRSEMSEDDVPLEAVTFYLGDFPLVSVQSQHVKASGVANTTLALLAIMVKAKNAIVDPKASWTTSAQVFFMRDLWAEILTAVSAPAFLDDTREPADGTVVASVYVAAVSHMLDSIECLRLGQGTADTLDASILFRTPAEEECRVRVGLEMLGDLLEKSRADINEVKDFLVGDLLTPPDAEEGPDGQD